MAISAAPCLKQVGRDLKGLLEDGFRATTVRNVGVAQHQEAGFKSHLKPFSEILKIALKKH